MMARTITATVDRWNPSPYVIAKAARIIKAGGLVAFPTETVYGLGADALNPEAVSKIFTAKGRPQDNPLILHISQRQQANLLVEVNDAAAKLMRTFWPGPLTIVLPAKDFIPSITLGGLKTAAVRLPDSLIARELISASGTPIAAPSANLSGRPSPTDADAVLHDMDGRIDMIVDGGSVKLGIESTVVDMTNPDSPVMLRPGSLSRELIESTLGVALTIPDTPVNKHEHYKPSIPVKIWQHKGRLPRNYAYMGTSLPKSADPEKSVIFTSIANYARGFFEGLRRLETEDVPCIIVEWPDDDSGISEGLRDRILRSAGSQI